uniref:putative bifunctional diguanylate cyclase/phosphodiesterase n=1 Tax=uncultured Sphingomonas sp. TaxID=158754 RepID=UPI0035CA0D9D
MAQRIFTIGHFGRTAAVYPLVVVAVASSVWTGAAVAGVTFAATALVLLVWNWRLQRVIERATQSVNAAPNTSADPAPVPLESGIADLAERLATVDHRLLATHPLSGMPMREALLVRIDADGRGLLGAIAFVDFDRLTAFDPTLGERVFSVLAARLRKMVPASRFLAQVDRGHVALWFGEQLDPAGARAELEAISYALGNAIVEGGREIVPQIELRLAAFDCDADLTPAAFLSRTLASFALAEDRHAAEAIRIDPAELARDRYGLEQDLRQAIARRELTLAFQPLIDAAQQRVCGAEALLRWHHPERGLVSPALFIPVMESIGLASEIGAWVLNAAVREAGEWRARGFADLRMAVNVSGLQLERDDLPILVERTLQRHAQGPACLEIELTESVATSDADHSRRIFQHLRAMGVKLAVDDFGTGYSGFSTLRTLRFDKIKIDREFVTDVDTRRDSQAICQSIIALARGLGIRVLAEGVERHAEYAWLRRHGCHHFQGYHFSRPLDADGFAAFVRDTRGLANSLSLGGERQTIVERLSA